MTLDLKPTSRPLCFHNWENFFILRWLEDLLVAPALEDLLVVRGLEDLVVVRGLEDLVVVVRGLEEEDLVVVRGLEDLVVVVRGLEDLVVVRGLPVWPQALAHPSGTEENEVRPGHAAGRAWPKPGICFQ